MAERELAILLTAKDLASGPIKRITGDLNRLGKAGLSIRGGLGTIGKVSLVAGGAVAAGLGAGIRAGIGSLASLEDATTQVDGAISQMGLTGKLTSGQVASWANQIEADVQAAFDDKAIVAGAASLIRYGQVADSNLKPAMVVMTDLAAKTGSVESAADLLASALIDPEKATKKLKTAGVVLTKEQLDQVKAMKAAGQTTQAQAFLLAQLERSTKGAAAASAGPFRDAQNVLADVTEDAQRALATGFLPVLQRAQGILSKEIGKPETLEGLRKFGEGIAGGLDSAITVAQSVPWGAVGDALKIGAEGAKGIVGAFSGMPDEAKGIVLALAGVSKLTGGAPIKIALDLAEGAFGQFFGRGTPINPMWVRPAGGSLGPGGPTGGGGGKGPGIFGIGPLSVIATLTAAAAEAAGQWDTQRIQDLGLAGRTREQLNFARSNAGVMAPGDIGRLEKRLEAIQSGQLDDLIAREIDSGKSVDEVNRTLDTRLAINALLQRDANTILRAALNRPMPAPIVNVDVNVSLTSKTVEEARAKSDRYGGTYVPGGVRGF